MAVAGTDETQRAAAEGLRAAAHLQQAFHPVEERGAVAYLRFDVHGLIAVHRIHDRRQVQLLRVGARKTRVAIRTPLHRRAQAVAVAEKHVVAHADLVAVVDDRRAGHRQQQAVHEPDALEVILQQRREPPPDSQVEARARIGGVRLVHVVALAAGDHLEGQLVVIAQEDRPLTGVGDVGGLLHDLHDRVPILLRDGHVHARHQREVIGHLALVQAVAEIVANVLGPLVGLRQQHAIREFAGDRAADDLDDFVGLAQVLVAGARAFHQVRDGIQPEPVHSEVQPEVHDAQHRPQHVRVVEVQVRLVTEKAVPVVRLRLRVPCPVGRLGVAEDDARTGIALRCVAPDVVVPLDRAGCGAARRLEPGVRVGGVIEDQFGNDPQVAPMRLAHEGAELGARTVVRMDVAVVGDVVAVVPAGGGIERQQPHGVDAQILDVLELAREAGEIPAAVIVAVEECAYVHFVDHGVLEPQGIAAGALLAPRVHVPRVLTSPGSAPPPPGAAAARSGSNHGRGSRASRPPARRGCPGHCRRSPRRRC